jgi:hypothetical protein
LFLGCALKINIAHLAAQIHDFSGWPDYIVSVRKKRALTRAVRDMNALVNLAAHRQLALQALSRIGLEHTG